MGGAKGILSGAGSIVGGCGTLVTGSQPQQTDRRPVEAEPRGGGNTAPSVKDFLAVCDVMARDMVASGVVQTATEPIVVEVRPVENKTNAAMDLTIYPQTIRGMILKQGHNRIAFRDENARKDILAERTNQSADAITVEETADLSGSRQRAANGSVAKADTSSESQTNKTNLKRTTEISGRVAPADYFLNGFICAMDEPGSAGKGTGYRYFRFQFRLTDARSGLVVWENDYAVKKVA